MSDGWRERQEGNKESSGINGASQAVAAWCHWGERADKEDMGREAKGGMEGSGEQRTIKIGKVSSESGDGILNSQSSRTASASQFN